MLYSRELIVFNEELYLKIYFVNKNFKLLKKYISLKNNLELEEKKLSNEIKKLNEEKEQIKLLLTISKAKEEDYWKLLKKIKLAKEKLKEFKIKKNKILKRQEKKILEKFLLLKNNFENYIKFKNIIILPFYNFFNDFSFLGKFYDKKSVMLYKNFYLYKLKNNNFKLIKFVTFFSK